MDTSALLAIWEKESGYERWQDALRGAAEAGQPCVCPVVFAELSLGGASSARLLEQLELLAITYENFSPESAHLVGCNHWKYRREGGPREHLVPDLLIAAHAQMQCNRLAAIDRGYLRRHLPRLRVLSPE